MGTGTVNDTEFNRQLFAAAKEQYDEQRRASPELFLEMRIQLGLDDPLDSSEPVELLGRACENTPYIRGVMNGMIDRFNKRAADMEDSVLSLGIFNVRRNGGAS